MERRWKIKEPGDSAVVEALAGELNVDKIVANLLVQRGVDSFSSAKSFSGLHLMTFTTLFL